MIQQLYVMKLKSHTTKEQILTKKKKAICKTQNFYNLPAFVLITLALLTAIGIYCYLIKYGAKQKHLLPFHFTNNKLKEIIY